MTQEPSISVIVPVYQAEQWLPRAVDSVRSQSFSDWELWLIDDGSRDRSPDICEEYAAQDSRIHVLHQPNGGVSRARNRGMELASGAYLAFLDADDALLPGALELLWRLRTEADADTAGGAVLLTEPNGAQETDAIIPAGVYDEAGIRERILLPLLGERLRVPLFNGYIVRYLFRASILRENAIRFEGGYLEDELFLLHYFVHARRLAMSETPIYDYVQNSASATHRHMRDFPAQFRRILARKAALAEQTGLASLCPGWRANTCWAGLLIAVSNEYAPGNAQTGRTHRKNIRALCALPEFAEALHTLHPEGMGRRKQLVAELLLHRLYLPLDILYRMKNAKWEGSGS